MIIMYLKSFVAPKSICVGIFVFLGVTGLVTLASAQTSVPLSTSRGVSLSDYPSSKAVSSWPTGKNFIALTFDDGPNPTITPKVIALLERKQAKGTFFLSGKSVSAYPAVVREYLTRPCAEIANHTWSHPQLSKISSSAVSSELQKTEKAIVDCVNVKPVLMRPPYGATNARVNAQIRSEGYVPILWDIDTNDWRKRSASAITEQVLREAHDGGIVLMHDRFESDLVALETIIDDLHSRGFQFVTVSEMLAHPRTPLAKSSVKSETSAKKAPAGKKTSTVSKEKQATRGDSSRMRKPQSTPETEVIYQPTPKPKRGLRKLFGKITGRS